MDTDSKTVIAQTKQVNDIASLSDRQCNYTNRIKIPKTSHNVKALNFMTVPGNTSSVPYQKNECHLIADNGKHFVYNGTAIISDEGENYEVVIYDGILDLYKLIENKSLSDLGLIEIDHTKTLENVIESWDVEDRNYRYLVADYNGDVADSENGEINIDYLVPSVWIPYLWEKLRLFLSEQLGSDVVFNGTIFQTYYFKLLYLSYPKGLATQDSEELLYSSSDNTFYSNVPSYSLSSRNWYIKYNNTDTYEIQSDIDGIHLKVAETGNYRLDVYGTIYGQITLLGNVDSKLFYGINCAGLSPNQVVANADNTIADNISNGTEIGEGDISVPLSLQAGDTICVLQGRWPDGGAYAPYDDTIPSTLTVKLTKLVPNTISFGDMFEEFSIKDFLNEIIQRFGLTIFKDSNVYTFLTMDEFIQNAEYVDWSEKYIETDKETNAIPGYAQINYFRYKYNDVESSYNDGYIGIDNVNLQDRKDVVKSKLYSPERFPVTYFGNRLTNTYKLWEKEANENDGETEVKYKQMDNRFYIMRAEYRNYLNIGLSEPFSVISKQLNESSTNNRVYFENFGYQSYREIVQLFYQPIAKILDKSIIISAKIWLNDIDIVNFDFKKLYFINQLSNYFIVNKINNYIPGKPTSVELIRVLYYGEQELVDYEYGITWYSAVQSSQYEYTLNYHLLYTPVVNTVFSFEVSENGQDWEASGIITTNASTYFIDLSEFPDTQYIRIHDTVTNAYSEAQFL